MLGKHVLTAPVTVTTKYVTELQMEQQQQSEGEREGGGGKGVWVFQIPEILCPPSYCCEDSRLSISCFLEMASTIMDLSSSHNIL